MYVLVHIALRVFPLLCLIYYELQIIGVIFPTDFSTASLYSHYMPLSLALSPGQNKELQVLFGHVKKIYLDKSGRSRDIWIQASSGMWGTLFLC